MTHPEQNGVHLLYHSLFRSLWGSFGGRSVCDPYDVSNLSLFDILCFCPAVPCSFCIIDDITESEHRRAPQVRLYLEQKPGHQFHTPTCSE